MTNRVPTVVVVHGIGFDSSTFASLRTALASRLPAGEAGVSCFDRPGYGDRRAEEPSPSVEAGADVLIETLREREQPVVLVGVSGGATIAAAAALKAPELVEGLVLHEPLLGNQSPLLLAAMESATRDVDGGDAAVAAFLATLAGVETWNRVTPELREGILATVGVVRQEVPVFLGYQMEDGDLERLGSLSLITTIGRNRGEAREEVAAVLQARAGAARAELASGHLPQLDDPQGLARVITSFITVRSRS